MMPSDPMRKQILEDIQTIYRLALDAGEWQIALRAKELQGKAAGIFVIRKLPSVKKFADFTEQDLQEFINQLEENHPELKN